MTNSIILETHNLVKRFGGLVAVAGVSLQIERGSLHSIIGPNGAGKTTFFNLLTGKYQPTEGRVLYNGKDITSLPVYKRAKLGIGRSFQITNIFPNLSVFENVRLSAQALSNINYRMFRSASSYDAYTRRAAEVLELVGLTDAAPLPANALPHGGKRKLELAILIAADADLLLLDEPTAGMASEQVPELLRIIAAIQQSGKGDKTIVMVEHNMSVVMNVSNRITVMNQGSVLAEGTPTEVAANKTVQSVYLGELYGDLNAAASSSEKGASGG